MVGDDDVGAGAADAGQRLEHGRALVDQLRVARPGMRVLFVSGYADDGSGSGVAAGERLLPKPFTLEALATAVRETLGG